jgi:hypothetical protein
MEPIGSSSGTVGRRTDVSEVFAYTEQNMTLLNRSLVSIAFVSITVGLFGAVDPAFAGPTTLGAPGPIAGVGLPVLAIGYGAYWLVKRYRRKTD